MDFRIMTHLTKHIPDNLYIKSEPHQKKCIWIFNV